MKNAYYFSHDNNARHDPRILLLRSMHNAKGYGWFWMLVEMMDEQGGRLSWSDPKMREAYAKQLWIEAEVLEQFVRDCCEKFRDENGFLFCTDGNYLWSESLLRRISERSAKSKAGQAGAIAKWQKDGRQGDKLDGKSDAKTMHERNERNERKEMKERKHEMRPESIEAVTLYMRELRTDFNPAALRVQALEFWDHFEANGWKISGKSPMMDWHAAVRTWLRNAVKFGHLPPPKVAPGKVKCTGCSELVLDTPMERAKHAAGCKKLQAAPPELAEQVRDLTTHLQAPPKKGDRKR